MGKISKFFKSLFGFKRSNPKRLGWNLFKSSHKQHKHEEAISAHRGSVQSRPHIQKTLKDDSIQVIKDQWEMPEDVIPNTLSFGVSSEINRKKLQNIKHLLQKPTRLNSTHNIPNLQIKSYTIKKKEDASLHEEDDGLKTILWEEVLNRAESWTDYDGELPVIALELERLIFEDLVNEVVLVEASHGKRIQPGRCRRRLSSK
ncbi:longifolia 1-like protein [Tanacetum coccineum]